MNTKQKQIRYTKEEVEGLRNALRNPPPVEKTYSAQEAIAEVLAEIKALEKDYDPKQIADIIKTTKFKVEESTLKSYIARAKATKVSKKTKSLAGKENSVGVISTDAATKSARISELAEKFKSEI